MPQYWFYNSITKEGTQKASLNKRINSYNTCDFDRGMTYKMC
jgi:hypothetical protein